MSTAAPVLGADYDDALREVANIAMGQAADSLARLFNHFVDVAVPNIRMLGCDELGGVLRDMVQADIQVTAVRQAFYDGLQGEAVVVFGDVDFSELASLMEYDGPLTDAGREELLLDVSNLLLGAFLQGVAGQLETTLGFSPPSILARHARVESLMEGTELPWDRALILEVRFALEAKKFSCYLLVVIPEQELKSVTGAIDRFIESI